MEEAIRGFGRDGYQGASLEKIAQAVGVRKQTLLYYFPTKDALLVAEILVSGVVRRDPGGKDQQHDDHREQDRPDVEAPGPASRAPDQQAQDVRAVRCRRSPRRRSLVLVLGCGVSHWSP